MIRRADRQHTSQQILDIAQRLVQTRGFNAFSYADIAASLSVSKASLHFHFPSKVDLGVSLIKRYRDSFRMALEAIDLESGGTAAKLRRYTGLYAAVLADQRMCLCGIMAAEFATLPQSMQEALEGFFQMNERWLTGVLDEGRTSGTLRFEGPVVEAAQFFIDSLEGSMLMARSHGGMARFDAASRRLLSEFGI